ncbi:MAG: hypothetical protein OHK0038_26600 [Flammeovirgaceae bacterium]
MSSLTYKDLVFFINNYSKSDFINLCDYDFIDPVFWTILKCKKIINSDLKIDINSNSDANEYIKYILGKSYSQTTVPIRTVETRAEVDKFSNELITVLNKDFENYDSEDVDFFKYILSELLNNAVDHGESFAVVSAQKFPKLNEFEISVVDAGLGFYQTIKRAYEDVNDDVEAIKEALKKGVTGAKTYLYAGSTRNVGRGLYVISQMVKDSEGELLILSGKGFYDFKSNSSLILEKSWNGSIVCVRLNLDKFKKNVMDFGKNDYMAKVLSENDEEEIF